MPDATLNVLLVEDEAVLRQHLQQLIEFWGYRVTSVVSAEEALVAMERQLPEIVITDLLLPGISGLAVLEFARQCRPAPPVLVITGHVSLDGAIEALKLGAYDYLVKPITAPELRAALDRARAAVELDRTRMRTQQMMHIAEVAMTLAHEINNPLAVLMGELQLRLEVAPMNAEEQRGIAVCLEAAQRIATAIRRLTDLQNVSYEQYGTLRLINLDPEPEAGKNDEG